MVSPPDAGPVAARRRKRTSGLGRVPLPVWLLIVVQTSWMLCVGVVYAPFQAPDEATHVDYVLAHRHGEWLSGPGERLVQSGVLAALGTVPSTASERHLSDTHRPVPREQRKSFDALGTAPAPPEALPNQMVQHPPLYYGLAAGFTALIPGYDDLRFDLQVFWLRLLSTLLLAPVPLLVFLAGRRLLRSDSAALVAGTVPLAVPSYLRTGASVNNDALLVLAGSVVTVLLARVLTGDLRRRTAVLLGLAWGAMLLTKGLALVLPPVIVGAYLVSSRGGLLARVRAAFLPCLVAGGVAGLVGGWWWVRNLVLYGQVQPRGYGDGYPAAVLHGLRPGASNSEFVSGVATRLVKRTFGSLGLIDNPPLPFPLLMTLFALLVLGVLAGLLLGLPGANSPRLAGVVLIAPMVLCLGVILVQLHAIYWQTRLFPGLQIRYFLPVLAGATLPVAIVLHRLSGRFAAAAPGVVAAAVGMFQGAVMLWYVGVELGSAQAGAGHALSTGLGYALDWVPWPPAYAVACAVVVVVSSALLVVSSSRLPSNLVDRPSGVPEQLEPVPA